MKYYYLVWSKILTLQIWVIHSLHNDIKHKWLNNYLVIYIKKDFFYINNEKNIENFQNIKMHMVK